MTFKLLYFVLLFSTYQLPSRETDASITSGGKTVGCLTRLWDKILMSFQEPYTQGRHTATRFNTQDIAQTLSNGIRQRLMKGQKINESKYPVIKI
tara:strand:- start:18 stop:302 length:285 start_codon:yes stop_codon:yes gene_type:complete